MAKPELSAPLTMRLPVEVLREIETIAEATDRSRSWVMVRALRLYLAGEGRDILAAVAGRSQIENGQAHSMSEVLDEIDAIVGGKAA